MTKTQFEHIQAIQISVHTAELQFSHGRAGLALQLSGSLINIARGSCQLTLTPSPSLSSLPCGVLDISLERLVMKAKATLRQDDFDRLTAVMTTPSPRPATVILSLLKPLTVSMEGILFLDHDMQIDIADISSHVPLK